MSCLRSRMADLDTTEVINTSYCSRDGCREDLAADPRRMIEVNSSCPDRNWTICEAADMLSLPRLARTA